MYDGPNRIEDLLDSGGTQTLTARYVDTLNVDEPLEETISGTPSYYEQDGLGSVTSLSNSAGALINTYSYDSYGKLLASTGTTPNPFQYTGREFDPESGAYYYRARYYDQNVGRFVSEDPIGLKGGIDFYAYVKNRPTGLADPDGTCPQMADSVSNYHTKTCSKEPSPKDRCACNCAYAADLRKCTDDCEKGCFPPFNPLPGVSACECLCNNAYNAGVGNSLTLWLCKRGCKAAQ